MRDLLRLAAHVAGIALTVSLIPVSGALMLTDHEAWGAGCLLAAGAAVWFAARLDHAIQERARRQARSASRAWARREPTMRLPIAPAPRRPAPQPPRALTGQPAAAPFGMAVYPGQTAVQPWVSGPHDGPSRPWLIGGKRADMRDQSEFERFWAGSSYKPDDPWAGVHRG